MRELSASSVFMVSPPGIVRLTTVSGTWASSASETGSHCRLMAFPSRDTHARHDSPSRPGYVSRMSQKALFFSVSHPHHSSTSALKSLPPEYTNESPSPVYSSVYPEPKFVSRLDTNLMLLISKEESKSYVCVESSKPLPPYFEISRARRNSKMNLVIKMEARLQSRLS